MESVPKDGEVKSTVVGSKAAARVGIKSLLRHKWRRFWLAKSGDQGFGRLAAWLASRHMAPYHQASCLADVFPQGFTAPGARITHPKLSRGKHVYIGGGCVIYSTCEGGSVDLGDRVQIYGHAFIETGMGGSIHIAENTHIQPGCHIHAFIGKIRIGSKVEIAPGCAFYCYDHGMDLNTPIMDQPLASAGDIVIGDGAWLGHGVTVLQGVKIGTGAVVAAGAVVTRDVPAYGVAGGVPAKLLKMRV